MPESGDRSEPTIFPDSFSDPPRIEYSEMSFQSESRSPDPFDEPSDSFFTGVMKIALGIAVGGVILWFLLELYARYQVKQLVDAVEQVAVQIESDLDRSIREARERELARQRARQEQQRLEKARQAAEIQARAEHEKTRAREQARKEAAWAEFYQPSQECLQAVSVECGNAHIRARREFERKYAAGEI